MRETNGHKEHSNFDEFWDKTNKLFEEYQTAIDERRHGTYHYLPFAISIRERIEQGKQWKPDITTPSEEWVWLQFMPQNPYTTQALRYTGWFPIKYMVQHRQMRFDHPDGITFLRYFNI